ncbi:MAG: hypothetical protein IJJ50_01190 [Lachnospiraceae bacterium]|nr:hypothetical protein [Lachnospiraceae bacterium]
MRKGSITVFLSLTMILVLSILLASLYSVRIAASRAVSAEAADEAVFSLFSEYDRDLFERYHLFFLDGGMDTGSPAFPAHIRFLKDSADYILHPGKGRLPASGAAPLALVIESCELTGYTTAAEQSGRILAAQAVRYMENTLGIQGVQLLLENAGRSGGSSGAGGVEGSGSALLSKDLHGEMEQIRKEAAAAASGTGAGSGNASSGSGPPAPNSGLPAPAVPEDFENPIETVSEFQKLSLLSLVLPSGAQVSEKTADSASLPSGRTFEPSLGVVDLPAGISGSSRLLFNEYVLQHCGCFTSLNDGALSYGAEYLLSGKPSDKANLTAVVRSLMLLRTGANAAAILGDASLKAQASQAALMISAALAIPEFYAAVEALLTAAWAWCESIVDLRALLAGKKVAPVKDASSWQLSVGSIPSLLSEGDSFAKDHPGGLNYRNYLSILLLSKKQDLLQMRLLDMIESTVRSACGRPAFRIDLCVDTLQADFVIRARNSFRLTARRQYSYREEVQRHAFPRMETVNHQ